MPSSLPPEGLLPFRSHDSFDLPLPQEDLTPYVDRIAVGLALNETYHTRLHQFTKLADQLPDLITAKVAIYQQATMFQTQQLFFESRMETSRVTKVLEEVKELLDSKRDLTNKQKEEVKAITRLLLIQPGRTDFDVIEEVMSELRTKKVQHGFESYFDSPARAKGLKGLVGREVSYVRSQYRTHIRDSVFGSKDGKVKRCGLTKMTNRILTKFSPIAAKREDLGQFMIRMLILRQFARENPALLNVEETLDASGEVQYGKGKKGRVPDGDHFWSQVTAFFEDRNEEWGVDLKSDGWSMYLSECIKTEQGLFPDDDLANLPLATRAMHEQRAQAAPGSLTAAPVVAATPQSASLLQEAFMGPGSTLSRTAMSQLGPQSTRPVRAASSSTAPYPTLPLASHQDQRAYQSPAGLTGAFSAMSAGHHVAGLTAHHGLTQGQSTPAGRQLASHNQEGLAYEHDDEGAGTRSRMHVSHLVP